MPVCIGIAGGTGSGKSTLAHAVAARLGDDAVILEQDWYYRDQSHLSFEERLRTNYDHPDALETDLLAEHVARLLAGAAAEVPSYDFTKHLRRGERRRIAPRPVVIVEGIHVLGHEALRAMMALKVYVDLEADLRLARRVQRDVAERGRTAESVCAQYLAQVRPMHERFVAPTKAFANLVLQGEGLADEAADRVLAAVRACAVV